MKLFICRYPGSKLVYKHTEPSSAVSQKTLSRHYKMFDKLSNTCSINLHNSLKIGGRVEELDCAFAVGMASQLDTLALVFIFVLGLTESPHRIR